jgi:hypothetical protein
MTCLIAGCWKMLQTARAGRATPPVPEITRLAADRRTASCPGNCIALTRPDIT